LQKRLMHHKQQLEDLEAAKKAFHASTQVWQPVRSVYLYSVHMEKENVRIICKRLLWHSVIMWY
jgi:hypothetical protein